MKIFPKKIEMEIDTYWYRNSFIFLKNTKITKFLRSIVRYETPIAKDRKGLYLKLFWFNIYFHY